MLAALAEHRVSLSRVLLPWPLYCKRPTNAGIRVRPALGLSSRAGHALSILHDVLALYNVTKRIYVDGHQLLRPALTRTASHASARRRHYGRRAALAVGDTLADRALAHAVRQAQMVECFPASRNDWCKSGLSIRSVVYSAWPRPQSPRRISTPTFIGSSLTFHPRGWYGMPMRWRNYVRPHTADVGNECGRYCVHQTATSTPNQRTLRRRYDRRADHNHTGCRTALRRQYHGGCARRSSRKWRVRDG